MVRVVDLDQYVYQRTDPPKLSACGTAVYTMEQLLALGFPEGKCRHFLAQCAGDVQQAVEAILMAPDDWEEPQPAVPAHRHGGGMPEDVPPPVADGGPVHGDRGSLPWTRGSFVGEFCDCFIDNTDLEGGQSAPALRDLAGHVQAAIRDRAQTPLLREHTAAVDFVHAQLLSAADLDNRDASFDTARRFCQRLEALAPGEMVTFCGGWAKPPQGHAIMYCIERTSADTFAWVIINTGEGQGFHPTSWHYDSEESTAGPRQRVRSAVRIEGIASTKLIDEVVFYVLLRLRAHMDKLHKPEVLYDILIPYLTDMTFLEAYAKGERANPSLQGTLETSQRAGTCYYRCVLSCLKYLLKRKGVPNAAIKQLTYAVRQKYLETIEAGLDVEVLDESHHRLIQIGCQQTALAAWKERRAGRLDQRGMALVQQLLQRIQDRLKTIASHPPPSVPRPLGAYESAQVQDGIVVMQQPFEGIPGCSLVHDGDDSIFRGDELEPQDIRPIDFLCGRGCAQPTRAPIETLEQAIQAIDEELEVIDQICAQERVGRVLPTKLVFFMSAVITDLVVNVLPTPLPSAKSGEERRCLWAQPTSADDQKEHLSKIYEISRIFTQISKQLPPRPVDRTAFASQCIVSTGLMAIFDALCRKKALDDTLAITTALRGRSAADSYQLSFSTFADVDFKILSANFLLDTPELARARSQLCEYIESTRSLNVLLQFPPSPTGDMTFRLAKTDPTLQFWKKLLEKLGMSDSYPPSIQMAIERVQDLMESDDPQTRERAEAQMGEIGLGTWAEPQLLTGWLVDDVYMHNFKCRVSWGDSDRRETFSRLYQRCPEALQLRNMVWNHKIVLQRSDDQIWTKKTMVAPGLNDSLADPFIYRIGYKPCPCPGADYCDLQLGAFDIGPTFDDGCLKFVPELIEPSPSDIGHTCYKEGVDAPRDTRKYFDPRGHEVNAEGFARLSRLSSTSTEDDIVQCPVLPSWDGLLSQTDAELLLSFLTVPMIRAPLVVDFFSTRVDMLFHPTMREILESVVFEPGRWVPRRAQCHIDVVPAQSLDDLAEPHGVLMNEICNSAPAICQPFVTILQETLGLPTANYKCPHMELVLFVCRVASRLQSYIQAALASDEVQPQSRVALVEFDEVLNAFLNIQDSNTQDSIMPTINGWLLEAEADDRISAQAKLRAHLALAARNLKGGNPDDRRNHNALSCGLTFAHLTFTLKWHSFDFSEERHHDDAIDYDDVDSMAASLSIPDQSLFDLYQYVRPQLCNCFVGLDTASQKQALTEIMRAATRQRAATWGTEVDDNLIEAPDQETVQALMGLGVSFDEARRAAKATRSARASLQTRVGRALDWVNMPDHADADADDDGGAGLDVRQNLGMVVDTVYNRSFQLQTGILLAAGNQEMSPVPESITMMNEYKERFGDVVVQCEQAGAQTNTVQSVRLVGYPVSF